MKNNFKLYTIGWALLLIVFNVIAIVAPGWPTLEKTTPSFWIGYVFISAAFIGQLICAWFAFQEEGAKKMFYNVSLITVSYAGLVLTTVVGLICMIVTPLPYWIGAIVCPLILVVNIIAVIKTKAAIDLVTSVDEKIEKATSFIYDMREESESLLARAKTDEVKVVCKKVRDSFKFSDPMSNDALEKIEFLIRNHFDAFKEAITEGKMDVVTFESEELLSMIAERNNKCKRMK